LISALVARSRATVEDIPLRFVPAVASSMICSRQGPGKVVDPDRYASGLGVTAPMVALNSYRSPVGGIKLLVIHPKFDLGARCVDECRVHVISGDPDELRIL
jgi:hypothetical protein